MSIEDLETKILKGLQYPDASEQLGILLEQLQDWKKKNNKRFSPT